MERYWQKKIARSVTAHHVPRDVLIFSSNDATQSPFDCAASLFFTLLTSKLETALQASDFFFIFRSFTSALELCLLWPYLAILRISKVRILLRISFCYCVVRKHNLNLGIRWFISSTGDILGLLLLETLQIHVWPLQLGNKCAFDIFF